MDSAEIGTSVLLTENMLHQLGFWCKLRAITACLVLSNVVGTSVGHLRPVALSHQGVCAFLEDPERAEAAEAEAEAETESEDPEAIEGEGGFDRRWNCTTVGR